MMNKEYLTVYMIASLRKYLSAAGVGIPMRFLQEGDEKDVKGQDEVQILTSIDFPTRFNETYALVYVRAIVKTKIVPTDVYYHTRIKARLAAILDNQIPLFKIGGDDTTIYNKSRFGILRRLPMDTMTITPAGIDVPDASVVETCFEYQPC